MRTEYAEAQHHHPDHHGPHGRKNSLHILTLCNNCQFITLKTPFLSLEILDAPCLNDHECHCEPPSPDTTPVCVDGHCQCLHAGWRLYLFKRFYILLFYVMTCKKTKTWQIWRIWMVTYYYMYKCCLYVSQMYTNTIYFLSKHRI